MNATDKTLLLLTARALFGIQVSFEPNTTDWAELYQESASQAVTLLNIMNNEQLLYEQEQVIQLLDEAAIPCVILKGSSSAANYPHPSLRIMGDIDLLVKPEQQMKAVEVLQANGYGEILEDTHYCHMTIRKENITVEVHKDPNGITLSGELAEKIRAYFSDAVEHRQIVNGLPFLQDDRQAVVLLLHKLEHFINNGFGMRQLCDWAAFVHNRMTSELWNMLKPVLEDFGLTCFANVVTRACIESIGLPEGDAPWAMEFDEVLSHEIMDSILSDGNFGRKRKTYGERLFTDPLSSNRVVSFFRVLYSACKEKWSVCGRHSVLMPIAPFVLFARYLKMYHEGKRSELHFASMFRQAGDRQKLIRELRPFIAE